jgi:anti-anti-sigma factor
MEMQLVERDDGLGCVRLNGRLDAPGADRIGVRFNAAVVAPTRNVAVDLAGVSFLASLGLRLLIAAARALDAKGARMVLFGAQWPVLGVLEDACIDQIIPVHETEADAFAALGTPAA